MIKNLLYSFFLHLILLTIIYFNFNSKKLITIDEKEFKVSAIFIEDKDKPKQKTKDKNSKNKTTKTKKENNEEITQIAKKQPNKLNKNIQKPKIAKKINKKKKPKKIAKKKKSKKKKIIKKDLKKLSQKKSKKISQPQFDESKDIENINLTPREKFNLKTQIKRCYIWATSQNNYVNKVKIKFSINISELGFIETNIKDIINKKRYKTNKDYQKSVDNAIKTIELCNPIRQLPSNKFDILKEINIEIGE